MESIVLYTTHCGKCEVLQKKLNLKNIVYEVVEDIQVISSKGFTSMPVLQVQGKYYEFAEAVKYVNSK